MIKPLLSAIAISALTLTPACSQSDSAPLDKAAIEEIVKNYILENPDIIEQAFEQRAERERALEVSAIAGAAAEKRDDLLNAIGGYAVGPEGAPVTVVEFLDYRCGNCKTIADWGLGLPEKYEGEVRVVFKEYPILSPQSETAALAAVAAGLQGKYIEMHRSLMALDNSSGFTDAAIDSLAEEAGIDVAKMREDMKSSEVQFTVAKGKSLAREIGVTGTPNFLIIGGEGDDIGVIPGAAPAAVEALILEALEEIS